MGACHQNRTYVREEVLEALLMAHTVAGKAGLTVTKAACDELGNVKSA